MPKGNRNTAPKHKTSSPYISARLRILAVLGGMLVLLVTIGAYLVSGKLAASLEQNQNDQLAAAVDSAVQGMTDFERRHIEALDRVRGTRAVPESVIANDGETVQELIEPLADNAGLNSVIVTGRGGTEVLGLQRVSVSEISGTKHTQGDTEAAETVGMGGPVDYAVSTGTELASLPMVAALLQSDADLSARPIGLAQTPQGFAFYTAGPVVTHDGQMVGVVLVGSTLDELTETLCAHSLGEVALYLPDGTLISTTFADEVDADDAGLQAKPEDIARALKGEVMARTVWVDGRAFRVGYAPFGARGQVLGVMGVYMPNNVFTATENGRQLLSLVFASLAAAVLVGVLVMVSAVYTRRLTRIRATVEAIGQGDLKARTGISAGDEVGALGKSIDNMAVSLQRRMELLALSLRAQRRETVRLNAVLASVPDGIVVLDRDSRVLLMNDAARKMFGSRRVFRDSSLNVLTAVVTDVLGPLLAPGIYALGTPIRALVNNRVLEAQAAAVMAEGKRKQRRIGTVIVLRDVTSEVRSALAREELIAQMAQRVQHVTNTAASATYAAPLSLFMQGMQQNMISLERMLSELRDLSTLDRHMLNVGTLPFAVSDFVSALVQDWQASIERAGLSVQVTLRERGLFILGDERRLRWALGNLIDNAVKYTQRGGTIGIVVEQGNDSDVVLTISDNGVGISKEDRPFVWQRFFRGTPRRRDGKVVRRAGSGQGLYIAKRVIEAHGGTITLDSWQGAGTDVRLTLPLVSPEPVEGWPGTEDVTTVDTGRYTVEELGTLPLDEWQEE